MAEIVNLRLVRKARRRADAAQAAAENRTRFGRTRGERTCQEAETERMARQLDGARREAAGPDAANTADDQG